MQQARSSYLGGCDQETDRDREDFGCFIVLLMCRGTPIPPLITTRGTVKNARPLVSKHRPVILSYYKKRAVIYTKRGHFEDTAPTVEGKEICFFCENFK